MFLEDEEKQPSEQEQQPSEGSSSDRDQMKRMLLFGGFTAVLLVLILAAFLIISWFSGDEDQTKEKTATSTSTTTEEKRLGENGKLPGEAGEAPTSSDKYLADVEAEELSFGQFYQESEPVKFSGAETYTLPFNVKEDVANYHEVSRRLQLDEHINDLNTFGFTRLDNQFEEEADNFYSSYRLLNDKDLPVLLTSDFLLYYYNSVLKQNFKTIENNIFYRNLWDINKRLYRTAKNGYEQRLEEVGLVNDPLLEARRLETAFFATSLKLLEPADDQIEGQGTNLSEGDSFSSEEAAQYSLELPEYLKPDVTKEMELIREGGEEEEDSPVLLYERNYREDFKVPEKYEDTARLNNFYLASNWLHSVFPLYYKGSECPDCLLDREDWRINMITAFLISKDFSENQELQNKWARIYKVISYFKGLREDLTYLDYSEVLEEHLGDDISLPQAFDSYEQADDTLKEMQQDLAEYDFSAIEGGYDKTNTSTIPKQGLKVLAPPYWPNDFIFERLTLPDVRYYQAAGSLVSEGVKNKTSCSKAWISNNRAYRCRGMGRDVINLVASVPLSDRYFIENTNYEFYDREAEELRSRLDEFDVYKWHGSSYWNLLDIAGKYINGDGNSDLVFTSGDQWKNRRIQSSLGAWTDLQTGGDKFKIYNLASEDRGLNAGSEFISPHSYIEPEPELVQELLTNIQMLHDMFNQLSITREASSIDDELIRVEEELERIKDIVYKELSGEELEERDIEFIDNFIKQYKVEERGEKEMNIEFKHSKNGMTESIDGVELLVVTYKKGNKKFFAVGPVYNYTEEIGR